MPRVTIQQTSVPLWNYHCPACNLGHEEAGHKAAEHAIYCEVCLEENSYVRLRRWTDETG